MQLVYTVQHKPTGTLICVLQTKELAEAYIRRFTALHIDDDKQFNDATNYVIHQHEVWTTA